MGKVIAVVSGKGGTGKTSLTANVGIALSLMGRKTLCLDCDVALRNLDLALGLSDRTVLDFSDVLSGGNTLASAVTQHPKYPNLYFLSAPVSTEHLTITRGQMQQLCRDIRAEYEFCLADASAGLGLGFQLATACADNVIVVTTTDPSSLRDAQRTVTELSAFGAGRVHLVVNRVQRKMLKTLHTTIDDAIDTAGLPLLGVVPEDSDVTTYTNRGIPLPEHNYYAYRAYENIAKRLAGKREALMKL
jgi:septum site-determining protein MinD